MLSYTFIEGFLEKHLEKNKTIALGTSSTSVKVIKQMALHNVVKELKLKVIPTSLEIAHILTEFGIPFARPDDNIDLAIEFVDFADPLFNYIKQDTTSLVIDKIIAHNASQVFVFLEANKFENYYDLNIPFEVSTFGLKSTVNALSGFGDVQVRMKNKEKARTVGGHYILDLQVSQRMSFDDLDYNTRKIPGILETGLFNGLADKVYTVSKSKIIKKADRL